MEGGGGGVGDDGEDGKAGRNVRAPSKSNPRSVGAASPPREAESRRSYISSARFEKSINRPDCSGFVSKGPPLPKGFRSCHKKKIGEKK